MLPPRYDKLNMDASSFIGSGTTAPDIPKQEAVVVVKSEAAPEIYTVTCADWVLRGLLFTYIISVIIVIGLGITYARYSEERGPGGYAGSTQAQKDQLPAILISMCVFSAVFVVSYVTWWCGKHLIGECLRH